MSFLPDNYNVPAKEGSYMKFQEGANRIRILGNPILGYVWWQTQKDGSRKPVRVDMDTKINTAEVEDLDQVRHFWAFPVYNYAEEKVQILEITQKGIQKFITALVRDDDWGDPANYDIVVTKTGQKLETEYSVQPKPAKKLDEGIIKLYQDMHIDLTALYRGEDPFNSLNQSEADKIAEDVEEGTGTPF